MARFHAVTWQEGNFDITASVMSFHSIAARTAYAPQCAQRLQGVNYARKEQLLREGRPHRLVLWDAADAANFKISL